MISVKEYMLEQPEINEDFGRLSDKTLIAIINKHKLLLSKAVRDGDTEAKKYQLQMIKQAEAVRRQRNISNFEERRAKAKAGK